MNTRFANRYLSDSSQISRELISKTFDKQITWVSYEYFTDYLHLEGIAIDNIMWLYNYLKYLLRAQRKPFPERTYFTFYNNRIYAISQGLYTSDIRLDFARTDGQWRRVLDTQATLRELLTVVKFLNTEDTHEECKELLYSTDCIHA